MRSVPVSLVAIVLAWVVCADSARAQYPQSYGTYYQTQVRQPGGVGPNANVNAYLYDKYFYHTPAVSPYQNLGRRSTSGSSYYQYVRPEQERRAAMQQETREYVQQRKLQGNVGHTDYSRAVQKRYGVNPSVLPYYNQYGRRY